MKKIQLFVSLLVISTGLVPSTRATAQPLNYIYRNGEEGFNCYRIPAIVCTNRGTLLAFAEGRKNGCGDAGGVDIVVKRSEDGGKTWSKPEVVAADGENTCGNPTPVVDRLTGRIFLLSTWNLGTDTEPQIVDGTSRDTRRVFVRYSTDDGRRWSPGKDITSEVKKADWTWYATGPGNGIQMLSGRFKGRLVVPCDHITAKTKKYYSHVILSDDGGKTWKLGGTTPEDKVNECAVAEIAGGRLVLNMRSYGPVRARQTAVSADGGMTWSHQRVDTALVEPICEGSLASYRKKEGEWALAFANPASPVARENFTVRLSYDGGRSWTGKCSVYKGPSGYSDLAVLPDGRIASLFEAGVKSAYEGIVFKVLSPSDFK